MSWSMLVQTPGGVVLSEAPVEAVAAVGELASTAEVGVRAGTDHQAGSVADAPQDKKILAELDTSCATKEDEWANVSSGSSSGTESLGAHSARPHVDPEEPPGWPPGGKSLIKNSSVRSPIPSTLMRRPVDQAAKCAEPMAASAATPDMAEIHKKIDIALAAPAHGLSPEQVRIFKAIRNGTYAHTDAFVKMMSS